mmetsp:Transcript_16052/g.26923  ORF Transcript_16052/g.26923 Transcript_16052/m.26923 type:complete len:274 (+) Transcript_16052:575-1396(+)
MEIEIIMVEEGINVVVIHAISVAMEPVIVIAAVIMCLIPDMVLVQAHLMEREGQDQEKEIETEIGTEVTALHRGDMANPTGEMRARGVLNRSVIEVEEEIGIETEIEKETKGGIESECVSHAIEMMLRQSGTEVHQAIKRRRRLSESAANLLTMRSMMRVERGMTVYKPQMVNLVIVAETRTGAVKEKEKEKEAESKKRKDLETETEIEIERRSELRSATVIATETVTETETGTEVRTEVRSDMKIRTRTRTAREAETHIVQRAVVAARWRLK